MSKQGLGKDVLAPMPTASFRRIGDTTPVEENVTPLPGAAYVNADYFQLEQERIFAQGWICVALASDFPNPGDVIPVTVAQAPLVLVRDRNASGKKSGPSIRAFHNICSHRGVQLISQPCQNQSRLRCPYHSWSYDLEGNLCAHPYFGGYGQDTPLDFDCTSLNLKQVRCEQWLDLIFINLSGDAPPLADYVKPVSDRWSVYDFQQLRYGGEVRFDIKANWKLAVENFSESYHLPWVHPDLNSYSKMEDHYGFDVGQVHAGQGSRFYKPSPVNGKTLPTFANLEGEWATAAEYVTLFPNTMLGVHPDHFLVLMVDPLGCDRSLERLVIYFVGDDVNPDLEDVHSTIIDRWKVINDEDVDIIERLQRGRYSPAFKGGCFSPALETGVRQFHQQIAKGMTEVFTA